MDNLEMIKIPDWTCPKCGRLVSSMEIHTCFTYDDYSEES